MIYCFLCFEDGFEVIIINMIQKTVQKHKLDKDFEIKQNLEYWLSRPPEERLEAVEILRRQVYEDTPGLQRVVRVIKRSQG